MATDTSEQSPDADASLDAYDQDSMEQTFLVPTALSQHCSHLRCQHDTFSTGVVMRPRHVGHCTRRVFAFSSPASSSSESRLESAAGSSLRQRSTSASVYCRGP